MEKDFLLLHRNTGKIRSFQLKVFHEREREIEIYCLHFCRVKWTFPPRTFLYIFHGTTHSDTDGIKAPAREGWLRAVKRLQYRQEGNYEAEYQRAILQSKHDEASQGLSSSECNKLFLLIQPFSFHSSYSQRSLCAIRDSALR